MNNDQEIEITEEDKKKALAKYLATPVKSGDELLAEYTKTLDTYCQQFRASSYEELMTRADETEFGEEISSEILEVYSFLQRNKPE